MTTTKLWSAEEAAKFLSMSTSWVYQAASAGSLPHVRIGRALRFDEAALRRWVDSQSQRPNVVALNLRSR